MTSRYRVEYALKTHRRDEFIEWIKGLLAVPFVLHAGRGTGVLRTISEAAKVSADARRRYAEIFYDVEKFIEGHIEQEQKGEPSRLKQLVPTVGQFFTELPLERAFYAEDERRSISLRRLVSPSFNDIRNILSTAQIMALATAKEKLKLITFDGDVTLYEDGASITEDSPMVPLLLNLLKADIYVGIVTAAGYSEVDGKRYTERLYGLIKAIRESPDLTDEQRSNLLIMGGEANFLFRYSTEEQRLVYIEPDQWLLKEMADWDPLDINRILDVGEQTLSNFIKNFNIPATIVRKEKSVGMIPLPGKRIIREQLEEVVLSVQKRVERLDAAQRVQFCAFNGGRDVWVDVGDKKLGVQSLQKYLGGIPGRLTLHVGDQFATLGANDFKARLAACTVWIASPQETVVVLEDFLKYLEEYESIRL